MSSGSRIQKVLAMDCESSGINWNAGRSEYNVTPATDQQAVSWGFVVADTREFKPIAELYVEIKWNGKSNWDVKAEEVHGLSREYLEEHGLDEEEALVDIIEFLDEHFDLKKPIYCLGHNVVAFDIPFLRDLLYRHEVPGIKFGHRHFDTFALSMGTVQQFDSPSLFRKVGLPERKAHNSLEDAKMSLATYRRIHKAWTQLLKK